DVLLWFTRETWLLVLLLWIKDLALAAAAGWIAVRLLSFTKNAVRRAENEPRALSAALEGTLVAILLVAGVVLRWIFRDVCPPGVWVDTLYSTQSLLRNPAAVSALGATPFGAQTPSHELVSNLYLVFCRGIFAVFGRGDAGFFAISAVPGCLGLP